MNKFLVTFEELLEENNLTIKSFSRKINVHPSVLYSYKNNNYLPSIRNAVIIANYFNCSLNYLMGLDLEKNNRSFNQSYDISVFYPRYFELLQKEKITHFALSKKIQLNTSSLLSWKNGKAPKMDSLIKISTYFEVSIDFLIGRV